MSTFYLAGKFRDGMYLLNHIRDLEARGYHCIHKWMLFEGSTRAEKAINDVDGVSKANFLLAFLTDEKYMYRGTMAEIGAALGYNNLASQHGLPTKKIYLVHPGMTEFTCFIHHPEITKYKTYESALAQILVDFPPS